MVEDMNVKIINGRAYEFYCVIASKQQYRRLKELEPNKKFRKFGNIVYVDVDNEYMNYMRGKI